MGEGFSTPNKSTPTTHIKLSRSFLPAPFHVWLSKLG